MAPHGRFQKTQRLVSPADFERVYGFRMSAASGPLVLYARPRVAGEAAAVGRSGQGLARLGVSVSRRIGNAVVRNRWKRRLREAFRAVQGRLPAGGDFVVVVRSGTPSAGAEAAKEIEETIVSLAARVTGRPANAAAAAAGPEPRRPEGKR